MDAINNRNLRHGRDGKTVTPDDHVTPTRRTVRHTDLKEWMAKNYPDQKPPFLFDETERKTHSAFNADSFRALQADRDASRIELEKKTEQLNGLRKDHEALLGERDSLRAMVERQSQPGERAETTYLKIILGIAMAGYKYDPNATRNTAISEIASDLLKLGISVSDDTIRDKLREAKDLLPREGTAQLI
jgi:hypothetical protein